jgi:site-specific DNA recombinase
MTLKSTKRVRCAIYTRVSTEYGLEQDFNSLDAQHDAAQAYIRSQAHDGWTQIRARYDDGGFSGGSTDRPALQQLLADIGAGRIDVVVVYKVDRLTRSLADFAKLVELFDTRAVSFVSVTQQFNTTTSMGRLTLNVLLSFAQFEREVTSERIRDKIAASKRKGLWVGGMVPLGYESRDRKLVIQEEEAERVRTIFRRYLELGSIGRLLPDLRRQGIVTKVRPLLTGKTIGGIAFTRGPLAYLLRNRFYIGEVVYKGQICPGEQPPILDRELFEAVQARLAEQRTTQQADRKPSGSLLVGRIFDDRGNRMSPSSNRSKGLTHRYYVSAALAQGRPDFVGSVSRAPAAEIEALVTEAVRQRFHAGTSEDARALVEAHVARVDVRATELVVTLHDMDDAPEQGSPGSNVLSIPWQKVAAKRHREIIGSDGDPATPTRPIRAEARARLVNSIAHGRRWLEEIKSGAVPSVDAIAAREGCSRRHVNMTISLAFLAPSLVKGAVEGRLPHGIGVVRLVDAPADWSRQFEMLGIQSPSF